ncbi:hypothetical protein Q7P35_008236 [Cladosporium inversicolor]
MSFTKYHHSDQATDLLSVINLPGAIHVNDIRGREAPSSVGGDISSLPLIDFTETEQSFESLAPIDNHGTPTFDMFFGPSLDVDTGNVASPATSPVFASYVEPMHSPLYQKSPNMPLELLESVEMGFLWNYFLNQTIRDIFCLNLKEAGQGTFDVDLYCTNLPQLAFTNRPLLLACLALSGFSYDCHFRVCKFGVKAGRRADEAERSLQEILCKIPSISTKELLAGICLAQLLVMLDLKSSKHLQLLDTLGKLRKMVRALATRTHQVTGLQSEFFNVVIKMFTFLEIMSGISLGSSRPVDAVSDWEDGDESGHNATLDWQDRVLVSSSAVVVDPILAFSTRLVAPFRTLGKLIRWRAELLDDEGMVNLQRRADQLEEQLLLALDADTTQRLAGSQDLSELVEVNFAYHCAAQILFYARLRGQPWTSSFIRRKVKDVIVSAEAVEQNSRTSSALLPPLFIAGCEAVDSEVRQNIKTRLFGLGTSFNDIPRIAEILTQVWIVRDEDPTLDWVSWLSKIELQYQYCLLI